MKRILLAAALVATCPLPALADGWWEPTRMSTDDPTWGCQPARFSPAQIYYNATGLNPQIQDWGNGLVSACTQSVCHAFARSEEACFALADELNRGMRKYQ